MKCSYLMLPLLSTLLSSRSAGCVLGLGLVLVALCRGGGAEGGSRVLLTLDTLLARLQDSEGLGRMQQEVSR